MFLLAGPLGCLNVERLTHRDLLANPVGHADSGAADRYIQGFREHIGGRRLSWRRPRTSSGPRAFVFSPERIQPAGSI